MRPALVPIRLDAGEQQDSRSLQYHLFSGFFVVCIVIFTDDRFAVRHTIENLFRYICTVMFSGKIDGLFNFALKTIDTALHCIGQLIEAFSEIL